MMDENLNHFAVHKKIVFRPSSFVHRVDRQGQVMLEFVFCMIILFLMMYGIVMVFRWVGLDLGQRQRAHDAQLVSEIDPNYGQCVGGGFIGGLFVPCIGVSETRGPLNQIDPYFYSPTPMNAVWAGN